MAIVGCGLLSLGQATAQTWSTINGGGADDWVYASTVYNGDLIVTGKFTSVDGVMANHIARWDGSQWHALGLGVNAKVNALQVMGNKLIVGGEFTEAGGVPMLFIAMWNGNVWQTDLGDLASTVTSLAVYNGVLVAGGYFTDADDLPVNYIAQHDGDVWAAMGTGFNSQVMTLQTHGNVLVAGGFFTTADGAAVSHIAQWNGSGWSAIGTPALGLVYALGEYNGNLIAGGGSTVGSWDGSSWTALQTGIGMSGDFYNYVFAFEEYNGNLIAGGYFTHSDGLVTNGIAQWDGSAWSEMSSGLFYPGNVFGAHTLCLYGSDLIVGGLFSSAGATSASHLAVWNSPITAVENATQNRDWRVFPNPSNGRFTVTPLADEEGVATVQLLDVAGRVVFTQTWSANEDATLVLDQQLDNGMYMLNITAADGQQYSSRVVIAN